MKEEIKSFKAANYGEVLAVVNDLELVSFDQDGGYQGDYLAVLKDPDTKRLFYFIGSYGSCSGCDWLEDKRDWNTDEVEFKDAVDYCAGIKPKYIVPESKPLKFRIKSEYGGWELED